MRRLINSLSLCLFFTGTFLLMSFVPENDGDGGRIKVYIVNNCSSDVDFKVASPGSSTHYTAYDGTKKPMTFVEGTKIYNSDGKLVHEVGSASEGKEIVVCN